MLVLAGALTVSVPMFGAGCASRGWVLNEMTLSDSVIGTMAGDVGNLDGRVRSIEEWIESLSPAVLWVERWEAWTAAFADLGRRIVALQSENGELRRQIQARDELVEDLFLRVNTLERRVEELIG